MKSECVFLHGITQYSDSLARYSWNSSPKRLRKSQVLENKRIWNQLSLTTTSTSWWFSCMLNKCNRQLPRSTPIMSREQRRSDAANMSRTIRKPLFSSSDNIVWTYEQDDSLNMMRIVRFDGFHALRLSSVRNVETSQREIPISISAMRADWDAVATILRRHSLTAWNLLRRADAVWHQTKMLSGISWHDSTRRPRKALSWWAEMFVNIIQSVIT
jgi:hypothetical protein